MEVLSTLCITGKLELMRVLNETRLTPPPPYAIPHLLPCTDMHHPREFPMIYGIFA